MRLAIPDDPVEAKILSALRAEPMHIDLLKLKVGLPVEQVSSALAMMELKGMVRPVGGMQYIALRTVYSGESCE